MLIEEIFEKSVLEVSSDFIDDDYNNIDVDYKRNLWKDIFVFCIERDLLQIIFGHLWPFLQMLRKLPKQEN